MARKNLQRLGKAAALLGTAFAASKMLGSGGEDAAIQKGLEVTRAKPFGQTDEAQTPGFFGTIRGALGRAGMRFQKGGSVVAKVKLGRTKPTKLY